MRKTILAVVAAMVVSAGALSAQEAVASRGGTATITIPTLLHIDVTNLSVEFDAPSFTDFTAEMIEANSEASVIDTRGNVVHDVTIEADAENMAGPWSKPASHLEWSTDGSNWTGLSTSAADVVTGVARGSNATVASVLYRMVLDEEEDVPGTYTLDFTYTVIAN
ncbi:MAG: hypothetical protein ACOC3J_06670 [Gemmatimonadota bacterium]